MNLRIDFPLAYFRPDWISNRQLIVSGDQPLLKPFSTNLDRCPSIATLLQFLFFRYCFKYALCIAFSALYLFLPLFAFTSSLMVDIPLISVFAMWVNVSPIPSILSMQNLSSSDRCFFLFFEFFAMDT